MNNSVLDMNLTKKNDFHNKAINYFPQYILCFTVYGFSEKWLDVNAK